jgi:hypothetical protein
MRNFVLILLLILDCSPTVLAAEQPAKHTVNCANLHTDLSKTRQ